MSVELLSALASVGTFVVILVTAIAAVVQLRHMRASNQIAALTEIRETMESPEFVAAVRFIGSELPVLMKDPAFPPRLHQRILDPDLRSINFVGNVFENLGVFVKYGIIDKQIACDLWAGPVMRSWTALAPALRIRRKVFDAPAMLENFEYLTVLCEDYDARHPEGSYPRGVRRKADGQPTPV